MSRSAGSSSVEVRTTAGEVVEEECLQLSESRYILAKYRLQKPEPTKRRSDSYADTGGVDVNVGPEYLTQNVHGGEFHCNRESCYQFVWCLCVPCIAASVCWIRCCEKIYDCLGKYITEKEEKSEMRCCTMNCCRL